MKLKNTDNFPEGLLSLEQENWFRVDAKTKRQRSFLISTFFQFFIKHIPNMTYEVPRGLPNFTEPRKGDLKVK